MPAQALHILHGVASIARFIEENGSRSPNSRIPSWIEACVDPDSKLYPFFCLGCQGPDIFYHNQRTRPVGLEYGSLLHRRGYGAFVSALARIARACDGEAGAICRAYVAGFLTHPFLDRIMHPYIIGKSGGPGQSHGSIGSSGLITSGRLHIFLERLIDALMFPLLWDREIVEWDQDAALAEPARHAPAQLKAMLADALRETFPGRAGKDEKLATRIDNVFLDAGRFFSITAPRAPKDERAPSISLLSLETDKGLALSALLYPATVPDPDDAARILNSEKTAWIEPCAPYTERFESVQELFSRAVVSVQSAFSIFLDEDSPASGFSALEACVGNSDLSREGQGHARCVPDRFDPLPLMRLLKSHYESISG